jgi:hypothetical protein
MITIRLFRTEAENLMDLLEDCDPKKEGTWRFDIADQIRETFGMCTRERSMEIDKKLKAERKALEEGDRKDFDPFLDSMI